MFVFDADEKFVQMVRHQGVLFAFAINKSGVLVYRVLTKTSKDHDDGTWSESTKLELPSEMRAAGVSLLTLPTKTIGDNGFAADAPFCLVSDGKWLFLFRQSQNGTLLVNRFLAVENFDDDGSIWTLQRAWEVRYQRSQNRDLPSSNKDTFGYKNLNGDPFIEPTLDLCR